VAKTMPRSKPVESTAEWQHRMGRHEGMAMRTCPLCPRCPPGLSETRCSLERNHVGPCILGESAKPAPEPQEVEPIDWEAANSDAQGSPINPRLKNLCRAYRAFKSENADLRAERDAYCRDFLMVVAERDALASQNADLKRRIEVLESGYGTGVNPKPQP